MVGHELSSAPGVVTRRTTLHGVWALPALALIARRARAAAAPGASRADELSEFLSVWAQKARELVEAGDPHEDAHVLELCAALARVDPASFPSRSSLVYEGRGMKTGPVYGEGAFSVVEIEMEPGAVQPPHNHPGFDFVSFATRGVARARHFEAWGKAADPKDEIGVDFEVQEVWSARLEPGQASALTRTRANIHTFVAGPEGATLLDFGVQFPDPGEGPKDFSVLEFDEQPVDAARRIHAARWIGNIYAKER